MAKSTLLSLDIDGIDIPLRVYKEWRTNTRISIGVKYVILRIPNIMGPVVYDTQINWAKTWIKKQFAKDPSLKSRFVCKEYKHNSTVSIYDKTYTLDIGVRNLKSSSGKILPNNMLRIELSTALAPDEHNAVVQKLVRRLIAVDNRNSVTERLLALNNLHFRENIKSVKLKYNTSNWGSCSRSRNLNISTRLLCAPTEVQDYVFIHELAHLKELNHSKRFWAIVEKAMPEYREHEKWLDEHGGACEI